MESQTALAKVTRLLSAAKAWVAALTVAVPGLTAFFVNLIETGTWDGTEWRILLATAAGTLLTGGSTYSTPAGEAEVEIVPGSIELPDDDPDSTLIEPDPLDVDADSGTTLEVDPHSEIPGTLENRVGPGRSGDPNFPPGLHPEGDR